MLVHYSFSRGLRWFVLILLPALVLNCAIFAQTTVQGKVTDKWIGLPTRVSVFVKNKKRYHNGCKRSLPQLQ
jgi:hypothetical protein